ncbi:MAG: helix-turn-helix domain-containing protein [Cyclobacteriaceae bacterium]
MQTSFPHYRIGHFINEPDNPSEFEITQFQDMDEPDVDDVHRHTFYEILWVDEGDSQQWIDHQTYELGPQSLFFISPGQVHEFEAWQPLKGGTIMFTADFFLLSGQDRNTLFEMSFLDNVYHHPKLELDQGQYAEIRKTIDLLINEGARKDRDETILRAQLLLLMAQIQRNLEQRDPVNRRYVTLYKLFVAQLEQQFAKGLTAAQYAAELNITQHHLNRVVKHVTGRSTSQVIQERVVLEAKRLLTFTDLSVTEVAGTLGYYDSSYFAKVFKTKAGQSPLTFREMSEKYRR